MIWLGFPIRFLMFVTALIVAGLMYFIASLFVRDAFHGFVEMVITEPWRWVMGNVGFPYGYE